MRTVGQLRLKLTASAAGSVEERRKVENSVDMADIVAALTTASAVA